MTEELAVEYPPDMISSMLEEAIEHDEGFFLIPRLRKSNRSPKDTEFLGLDGGFELTPAPSNDSRSGSVFTLLSSRTSPLETSQDHTQIGVKLPRPASASDEVSISSTPSDYCLNSLSWSSWQDEAGSDREYAESTRELDELFRNPSAPAQHFNIDPGLRRLIKRGFPDALRPSIWQALTGANALRNEGQYHQLLEYAVNMLPIIEIQSGPQFMAHKRDLRQIELDISRTLCKDAHFLPQGQGRDQLRRILSAYAWRNQEIGYCQGLNVIAGILLIVLTNEEDTYWALVGLVENILPPNYFTRNLLGVSEDTNKFRSYVERLLPSAYVHFCRHGIDIGVVSLGWFLTLYAECVDRKTLYRLWDRLLLDGPDFLHGIGLGLLRTYRSALLAAKDMSELLMILQDMSEGGKALGSKFLRNVSKMEGRLARIRDGQTGQVG